MNTYIKELVHAALVRALRTFAQTLAATIPVGLVITPAMIETLDMSALMVVVAWLATALLAGLASFLTCVAAGLPEVGDPEVYEALETLDAIPDDGEAVTVGETEGE
jgi:hypothetical protein